MTIGLALAFAFGFGKLVRNFEGSIIDYNYEFMLLTVFHNYSPWHTTDVAL